MITLLKRAMSIIREEIAINFQPYPKTNVRCRVPACTFFAEHPYNAELGNLNRGNDFALRAVEMHLIQHRVLGDLDVGAGPGHDLGGEERLGQPTVPRDNPQPAEEQINTGPQSLKASPSQQVSRSPRKKKKKILQNIEKTLLERQRVGDEETDRLRSNGGSLKFLYKSTRATLKEEAVQVCGWKRRDILQACQHPFNKRRRRCHKHSQVHGNVTVRCPYCVEISLEV